MCTMNNNSNNIRDYLKQTILSNSRVHKPTELHCFILYYGSWPAYSDYSTINGNATYICPTLLSVRGSTRKRLGLCRQNKWLTISPIVRFDCHCRRWRDWYRLLMPVIWFCCVFFGKRIMDKQIFTPTLSVQWLVSTEAVVTRLFL